MEKKAGYPESPKMESVINDETGDQHRGTETDENEIDPVIFQLIQPGTFVLTKAAQVHGVGHIFAG